MGQRAEDIFLPSRIIGTAAFLQDVFQFLVEA